jgi:Tol biopolymer transport system component
VLLLLACLLVPAGAGGASRTQAAVVNGLVAYSAQAPGDVGGAIYVSGPDGSKLASLSTPAPGSSDGRGRWSRDGSRLVFDRCDLGGTSCQIFVVGADGKGQTELTSGGGLNFEPAWSPDGKQIAFTSTRDGRPAIYAMNADGSGQHRVTPNDGSPNADSEPDWSPDGTRIVFTRVFGGGDTSNPGCDPGQEGSSDIWVVHPDGSGLAPLVVPDPSLGFGRCLANARWSPDGSQILVNIGATTLFDAGVRIGVAPAGGGSPAVVPSGVTSADAPLWSPDGKTLLFTSLNFSFLPGPTGIYQLPLGGSSSPFAVAGLPAGAAVDDWAAARPAPPAPKPPARKPPAKKKPAPRCKKGQKSTKRHPCRKR